MNFEKKYRAYVIFKIVLILAIIFYNHAWTYIVFVFIMLTYVMDNIYINEITKSRENNKKQRDKEITI